jgi:hypothetical protein
MTVVVLPLLDKEHHLSEVENIIVEILKMRIEKE